MHYFICILVFSVSFMVTVEPFLLMPWYMHSLPVQLLAVRVTELLLLTVETLRPWTIFWTPNREQKRAKNYNK